MSPATALRNRGGCLLCGWKLYSIYSEYKQGEKSYEQLSEQFIATVPETQTEIRDSLSETGEGPKLTPVTVDFDALLEKYPDVVGWLYSEETPINYPVMQDEDNLHYIHRLITGEENSSGSIFMDYRCASDFSDWNTILYGHNMKNDSMFGTLQDYRKQDYYDAHPVLYLLTPGCDYRIELVAGYTTTGYETNEEGFPETEEARDALVETAVQRSTFLSGVTVEEGERIITLSTCSYDYDDARYVLVGVLRELK